MEYVIYCVAQDSHHADEIVTALHIARFGASDISIIGETPDGDGSHSTDNVVSFLQKIGIPEDEALLYAVQIGGGGYLIAVEPQDRDQLRAARFALQKTCGEGISSRILESALV